MLLQGRFLTDYLCDSNSWETGTSIYSPQRGNWWQTKVRIPVNSNLVNQWVLLGWTTGVPVRGHREERDWQRQGHHSEPHCNTGNESWDPGSLERVDRKIQESLSSAAHSAYGILKMGSLVSLANVGTSGHFWVVHFLSPNEPSTEFTGLLGPSLQDGSFQFRAHCYLTLLSPGAWEATPGPSPEAGKARFTTLFPPNPSSEGSVHS